MIDDADLETNLLEFVRKSFAYASGAQVGDRDYVRFHRTETETESRFRPKVIQLHLVVPRDWIALDAAGEALQLVTSASSGRGSETQVAMETSAEKSEFREQGIYWKRFRGADGSLLYVPLDESEVLLNRSTLRGLGLSVDYV